MSIDSQYRAPCQQTLLPNRPRLRPRIGFVSLGCPKNLVDSEVMMGMLSTNGAEITSHAEDADIIVVNTCSFIDTAKQESVDTILEMVQHKTHGRASKLIVTGCLVERYRDEIQKNIPGDRRRARHRRAGRHSRRRRNRAQSSRSPRPSPFSTRYACAAATRTPTPSASQQLKGGQHVEPAHRVPKAMPARQAGRFARDAWDGARAELPSYLYDENTPRLLATARHSAYIKIAEGCDHPCAFCIIPQLRGKFRSRTIASGGRRSPRALPPRACAKSISSGRTPPASAKTSACRTASPRCSNSSRRSRTCAGSASSTPIPTRSRRACSRFSPATRASAATSTCPCSTPPPQVLKRMKRGGSAEIFLKLIAKMRAGRFPTSPCAPRSSSASPAKPKTTSSSSATSSPPPRFDWLGVFAYSDEEGSPAFLLDGKVPPKEIERRRRKLMQLQKRISRQRRKQWIGREIEVMLEGPSEETDLLWEARTPAHAPEIDGKVFINDFGEHDRSAARQLPSRHRGRGPRLRPGRAIVVDSI